MPRGVYERKKRKKRKPDVADTLVDDVRRYVFTVNTEQYDSNSDLFRWLVEHNFIKPVK